MNLISRFALLVVVIAAIAFTFVFFRRLGWSEVAVVAAIVVLALIVEIVRYLVKQFMKGYRN
jgi:hypothetical protein